MISIRPHGNHVGHNHAPPAVAGTTTRAFDVALLLASSPSTAAPAPQQLMTTNNKNNDSANQGGYLGHRLSPSLMPLCTSSCCVQSRNDDKPNGHD